LNATSSGVLKPADRRFAHLGMTTVHCSGTAVARRLRRAESLSSGLTNESNVSRKQLPIVSGFSWYHYQALCSIRTASNSRLQRPSSVHFSTMNRIASSQHCHLLLDHVCQLMQLSNEGPDVLDVRDGTGSLYKVAGTAKTGLQLLNWIFQFSCSSRLCCMPMNWTIYFELWTTVYWINRHTSAGLKKTMNTSLVLSCSNCCLDCQFPIHLLCKIPATASLFLIGVL